MRVTANKLTATEVKKIKAQSMKFWHAQLKEAKKK